MTVKEIVETVIEDLYSIKLPVSQLDSVGMPIKHAIQGLQLCVQAWNEEEVKQAAQAQEDDDDVKLEVVPAEEVPEEIRKELDGEAENSEE